MSQEVGGCSFGDPLSWLVFPLVPCPEYRPSVLSSWVELLQFFCPFLSARSLFVFNFFHYFHCCCFYLYFFASQL